MNTFGYGDHYVHLKIKVPRSLNAKQRALLQAYAEIEEDTPGVVHGIVYTKDGKLSFVLSENTIYVLILKLY